MPNRVMISAMWKPVESWICA